MSDDLISRSELKAEILQALDRAELTDYEPSVVICEVYDRCIDNAPTVEPFEPDYVGAERLKARQRGYEEGYHMGMKIGKTLNPKIKKGEWIREDDKSLEGLYRCSECGRRVEDLTDDIKIHAGCEDCTIADIYPYCHCGAKMT